ncbi:MAG: hypothetical protein B7Y77_00800 [Bradyrhizobium sp. 35-63-5]|nr:MAG: hypothetical protein B7Y77_00800 [Bradyrhizobium sp. 35-63-5]
MLVAPAPPAPPAPPPPPAPPAPPGPPLNAWANTFLSSSAWALVNLPLLTSPAIRSSILDFMSSDDGGVEPEVGLLACIALSISSSAELSAD